MTYKVESCWAGRTLKDYLFSGLSLSRAQVIVLKKKEQGMLLNGERVTVRALLMEGDLLELELEDEQSPEDLVPYEYPLQILYEDENLILINKPQGMPTHPSHGHFEDTLANALAHYFAARGEVFTPRFINRLDRDTTGVVLVARHALSAAALSGAMARGEIKKSYLALAVGEVREPQVIDANIRRAQESIILREVCPHGEGDRAVTEVIPLATGAGLSLLRLIPHTGRTHQLRVHLASVGHSLLGDGLYGCESPLISRHALHAAHLCFTHPVSGAPLSFTAPLPPDMRGVIEKMGGNVLEMVEKIDAR